MAHAAEQLDLVGFEAHARAAPVAEPPARELGRDVVDEDGEARGQALDVTTRAGPWDSPAVRKRSTTSSYG